MFKFVERILQPWQKHQESIRLFPLPCPIHGSTLVPEAKGNGEFVFYCALCRMACHPVEDVSRLPTLKPSNKAQESQQNEQKTGAIMHTYQAKKRMVERLKSTRLVLVNTFDGNTKPGDSDSLEFGNALTEHTLPRVKKALPDVG